MKFRNDFVTNSSSSSFIIALKDTAVIQEKSKQYLNFIAKIGEDDLTFDKFVDAMFKCQYWVDEHSDNEFKNVCDKSLIEFFKANGFSNTQIKVVLLLDEDIDLSDIYSYIDIESNAKQCEKGSSIYFIPLTDQDELSSVGIFDLIHGRDIDKILCTR